MTVKQMNFNDETGEVDIERTDGSLVKYNMENVLTATTTSDGGVDILDPRDGTPLTPADLKWDVGGGGPSYSLKSAHIEEFGTADANGFWDAALAAAMVAAGLRGGIELLFTNQSLYKFASNFPAIPNDGGTAPQGVPIVIKGAGCHWSGRGRPMNGSTVLDFQGVATYGKITLNTLGLFKARDITFTDSTASGGYLIYTTNTTLDIQNCAFVGTKQGALADQDAICLGGPNQVEGFAGLDDGFQGYGTVIARTYFHRCRRIVYGRAFCNAVSILDNTVWTTCGASDNTAAIELDGAPAGGAQVAAGCFITGNLIELPNYAYGVKLANAQRNYLHNRFYDSTAKTVAAYRLEDTAQFNRITESYTPGTLTLISASATNKTNRLDAISQGVYGVSSPTDYPDSSYPLKASKLKIYGGTNALEIKPDAANSDSIALIKATRSAAEAINPEVDVFRVMNGGEVRMLSAYLQTGGNRWVSMTNGGVGQNMTWDSGTGGNYNDIRGFAIRYYDQTGALIATMSSAATGWNIQRPLTWKPAASQTPAANGELTFEATSNTTVTVKLKGSDGIVRSAALTLA